MAPKFTVGCVPYLNAKPLVRQFKDLGTESPVRVIYGVPSQLPSALAYGSVQAILVSSIEAIRAPSRVVDDVAIASRGVVQSVRLFSKLPFEQIRTLALDQSSMTSNALAQMILKDSYGVMTFDARPTSPDLEAMLETADAALLIGDNGMRADDRGLHVLDLGQAWSDLTGLPFVWAVWMGGVGLDGELAGHLQDAARWGRANVEEVVPGAASEAGFSLAATRTYLGEVMDYELGPEHKEGLRAFGLMLAHHGLLDHTFEPTWMGPAYSSRK